MTAIPSHPPIPLVVLAGYLGAGKTTLLRRLVTGLHAGGATAHVLLNDYQNAYVDAAALRDLVPDILPLSGTCICCGTRDELLGGLAQVRPAGRDIVLIEANGTADTVALIELLAADRRAAHLALPCQVAVVDALRWQTRHWNNEIEALQVRTASFLHLTRAAEVPEDRLAAVVRDLTRLNARAERCAAPDLVARLLELIERAPHAPPRRFDARASAHVHSDRHHLSAVELTLPRRVSRRALEDFLRSLPPRAIRVKGVAFLDGEPAEAVLFQRVEGRAEPVSFMKLGHPEGLEPVAICVGVELDAESLRGQAATLWTPTSRSAASET